MFKIALQVRSREFFVFVSDSGMGCVLYMSISLSSVLFMHPLVDVFLNDSIVDFRLITKTPGNLI
jgi:hypothetical protein